jgi:HlyD family secretion protein
MSKDHRIILSVLLTIFVLFITSQIVQASLNEEQDNNSSTNVYQSIEVKEADYIEKGALKDSEWICLRNDSLTIDYTEGNLVEYLVINGQEVIKGDPLLSYQIPNDKIAIEQNLLLLKNSENTYQDELVRREGAIAESNEKLKAIEINTIEAEILKLNIRKMEIELEQYRTQSQKNIYELKNTIKELEVGLELQYIYAPYNGVISIENEVEIGTKLNSFTEVMRIYDTKSAVLRVAATGINKLRYNMEVNVTGIVDRKEDTSRIYEGRIIGIDSVLDNIASTGMIYIQLEEENLLFSLPRVNLTTDTVKVKDVLVIPLSAVEVNREDRFVYVEDDNGVIRKQYITGRNNGIDMWVYNGLKKGQRIIVE